MNEFDFKELALKINPNLKSHQDQISGFWIVRNSHDRNVTDWYMFEESAWEEVTKNHSK